MGIVARRKPEILCPSSTTQDTQQEKLFRGKKRNKIKKKRTGGGGCKRSKIIELTQRCDMHVFVRQRLGRRLSNSTSRLYLGFPRYLGRSGCGSLELSCS